MSDNAPSGISALLHFDDGVGGQAGTRGRGSDGLRRRRLIQAVGLSLVRREERVHPANALLVVDPIDTVGNLEAGFQFLGKVALDHEDGHGGLLFTVLGRT